MIDSFDVIDHFFFALALSLFLFAESEKLFRSAGVQTACFVHCRIGVH
jgi:hypothetical protein